MRTKRATNAWSLRWHMTALLAASLIATAAFASSLYPPQTKLSNASLDAAPDPVSASDGSFYFDLPLLQLGGPMGLGFRLSYDSTRPKSQWDLSDLPEQGKWWWDPKATCLFMNMGDHTALQFQIERGDAIAFVKFPGETWRLSTESDYGMPGSPVAFQLAEIFLRMRAISRAWPITPDGPSVSTTPRCSRRFPERGTT